LVCRTCVFEAEWHDLVAKVGIFSDEFHFLFVWRRNYDLVVSRVGVQEAWHQESVRSIDQLVDARERVCVFGACPVQISVIGAHSPFIVGLFDHDDVGEPGGKPDFSNEVCMEELVNFFFDGFTPLFSHLPFHL